MGEVDLTSFPFTFNGSIKVESRPERLTADAGALILRELDERMGWTEFLARNLHDPRNQDFITHPMVELLRTRMYLIAQGWNDQDDADHLRDDPAFRVAVSTRRGDGPLRTREEHGEEENLPDGLASQPTMSRLVDTLATEHNLRVLHEGLPTAVGFALRGERGHRFQTATLDVDSFPINVHGSQAGSEYNGYYHRRIFNPIVAMVSETEDFVGARLREGNASTAENLEDFLMPILEWMEREICVVASVRGDAGMPSEPILARLEAGNNGYCFRLKSNNVLERLAKPHLRRPPGGRPKEERVFFRELSYKADAWSHERRVVLVMIDRPGELFLHHFFLLTNWGEEQMPAEELLAFYRKRGTHEGHLGEFMNALKVALSCTSRPKNVYGGKKVRNHWPSRSREEEFFCNEATLLLYVWAYNLANRVRHLVEHALPQDRGPSATPNPGGWSLSRVQQCVLRVVARFLLHSRRVVAVIGETSARLWNSLAPLIGSFPKVEMPKRLHAFQVPDG
jgi:hypothetical protein